MQRRKVPDLTITEAAWQATIVAAAHATGWLVNHTRRSIGAKGKWVTATSVTGWPDLELAHPKHGIIYAELKRENGYLTDAQAVVLDKLRQAGGRVFVWRPSDWDEVQDVLSGRHV